MTGATGRPVANSELAQVSSDGLVVTIGHDRWQEDWEVKLHKPRCARSVLGPCHNGRARASAGTNGHQGFRGTAGRWPSRSRSWDNADGRFRLWSRRSGSVRRAADGQQPVSVTTGEPARKPWRIMTADAAIYGY